MKRFTTFDLAERYEQDDTCDVGGKVFYHKSLLYLVARGLESGPDRATGVVPLVGLEATLDRPVAGDGRSLRQVIDASGGRIVIAPGGKSLDLRSDAKGHGDFDNDQATLNAVLLRMLRKTSLPVFGAAGAKAAGAKAGAKPRRAGAAPEATSGGGCRGRSRSRRPRRGLDGGRSAPRKAGPPAAQGVADQSDPDGGRHRAEERQPRLRHAHRQRLEGTQARLTGTVAGRVIAPAG